MLPALSSTTPPWQGPSDLWPGSCSKKSGAIAYLSSAAKVVVETSAITPNVSEQRSRPVATGEMDLSMANELTGFPRLGKQEFIPKGSNPPATPHRLSVRLNQFREDF